MKTKVKIWVTLVGLLIGAVSYWRIPYAEMNYSEIGLWLSVGSGALIGSLLSNLILNQNPWRVALLITLGVVLAIVIRIIYDTTFWDSTSHNLAPFEVGYGGLQSLPMTFFGAYLAKLIHKFKN